MNNLRYPTGEEVCGGDLVAIISDMHGKPLHTAHATGAVELCGGNLNVVVCGQSASVKVDNLRFMSRAPLNEFAD